MALSGFSSWQDLTGAIIHILQLLIVGGISLRCILIIQKGREQEASWKQIGQQLKGHVLVVAISLLITEIIMVVARYYT